jgi:hypothetical protein
MLRTMPTLVMYVKESIDLLGKMSYHYTCSLHYNHLRNGQLNSLGPSTHPQTISEVLIFNFEIDEVLVRTFSYWKS